MSDLTINISRLSESTHRYEFETEPKNVDLDARFTGSVKVLAVLEKTGQQIHLKADLKAKCLFGCDRCLDEFEQDLFTRYEIVYSIGEGPAGGSNGEEIRYLSADANLLELGEDVRQFLVLAVPQKLLCKDDCRGLCPKCGVNRNKVMCDCAADNADPRWEVLRNMSLN